MELTKAVLISSGFMTGYRIPMQENISGLIYKLYLLIFSSGMCV